MRFYSLLLTLWLMVCPLLRIARAQQATTGTKSSAAPRLLLAHYMPWFEAAPANKQWGWHWTMNHYHPDHVVNGRREAASHYYPLLGTYDSNDPDVLECHVLLMKFAGVDGVFIDWSGIDDFLDYSINHRNTLHLISYLKKAGLKFAVVYEDATVPKLVAASRLPQTEVVAHGKTLMQWLQTNWFTNSAYLKLEIRPVFLVFGSGYYQSDQWNQIFSALPQPPQFFTESNRRVPAIGGFDWPQPGKGTEASLRDVKHFYALAPEWSHFIPAAFPRFHDIYAEAEVQKSWGRIEDREGKTYEETLELSLKSSASLIQLVTWNDWGEGTQIEPSVEFGYRDLEATQRIRHKYLKGSSSFTAQDLRLPVELYTLRKKFTTDKIMLTRLDEISNLLFRGQLKEARKRMAVLSKQASASSKNITLHKI